MTLYHLLKPIIFRFPPELAHDQTVHALKLAQRIPLAHRALEALFHFEDPILAGECAGMRFVNPFGMAAGFDKQAELIPGLAMLGFGHVEIGTVTPLPQPGNPRPRMFRLLRDDALVNRMGFNSEGMYVATRNLERHGAGGHALVGVNIGKNKVTPLARASDDYVRAFDQLASFGRYVAVNISSPNTPGLRKLHDRAALAELLGALAERNRQLPQPRPIFVKVSPDETPAQLDAVVEAALGTGMAGFIAGNTTVSRAGIRSFVGGEIGGLSGRPLTLRARSLIAHLHRATSGNMPVIGVGGIMNAEDAYLHLRAGASMLQIYTVMVYEGPGVVRTLKQGLADLLRRDGFRSLGEAVGVDAGLHQL
ncbi:quinone-dependent dihydroorotate dehydrogenase [Chloroflexia bacterium SDU3-3]|nr:quinone-dependent dihydroorotate dehydrogenase [Chloroflexia bacterium SDU3-3]